jgi:hypothetical protein
VFGGEKQCPIDVEIYCLLLVNVTGFFSDSLPVSFSSLNRHVQILCPAVIIFVIDL